MDFKEKIAIADEAAKILAADAKKGVANGAKKAVEVAADGKKAVVEKATKAKEDFDRKMLCPVFQGDLNISDYPMIRILESDPKHDENPVCDGSIGFESVAKGMKILNLYTRFADQQGLRFYPLVGEDVFYIDPCSEDLFISLDDYFSYSKKARVAELTKIAQTLGAKHIRITLKERRKSFVSQQAKLKANVAKKGAGDASHEKSHTEFSNVEVAAETSFIGHDPERPELKYFANETAIKDLVEMRMSDNTLQRQTLSFKYNSSSGIKEKNAIQIDAALALMKLKGTASVLNEIQNESWLDFWYEIEF